MQLTICEAQVGTRELDEGMAASAYVNALFLEMARLDCWRAAIKRTPRTATADDVQPGLNLGNAAGSIFKSGHWFFTGEWQQSTRKSNHARYIRVWGLRNG